MTPTPDGFPSLDWYEQKVKALPGVKRCLAFDDPNFVIGVVSVVIWGGDVVSVREWLDENRPAGIRVMLHYQTPRSMPSPLVVALALAVILFVGALVGMVMA